MKLGRNAPCPCGSGKKYKRCCMEKVEKKTVYLNPNFTMRDFNAELQRRMAEQNQQPKAEKEESVPASVMSVTGWLDAPFKKQEGVTISTPDDVTTSPVMRYLHVILEEAISQGDSFKVTAKGNLPLKIVKAAQALLPEFVVSDDSASDFKGSNEERFSALRYARALAEYAGIIEINSGRLYVKDMIKEQYQTQGISAFFMPMLEAAAALDNVNDKTYLARQSTQYWGFVTIDSSSPEAINVQPLFEKTFKFSV